MTTTNPSNQQLMLKGLESFMNLGLIEEQVVYEYTPSPTKTVHDLRKQLEFLRQWYRKDNNLTDEQLRALRFAMAAMKESLKARGSHDD